MHRTPTRLASAVIAIGLAAAASAQGAFVNFEVPQVKPLALATVGGIEFLLVCNTPDSSVEIYDPNTASPAIPPVFLARVPVGQGPASVRFDPETECFYTANYIGDSVTKVQLINSGGLQWSVVATKPVGEAPADLALSDDGLTLFVTLADASQLATLDPNTLAPLASPTLMMASPTPPTMGVKEPRRIEVQNGAHWVLNMKGGNVHAPHLGSPAYDLDIWTHDPATSTTRTAGLLGTTNAGMAFGSDGLLYVVGSLARNDIKDEANLQALELTGTGFVESWLWVVDPALPTLPVTTSRDLNRGDTGGILTKPRTCSQPMDVALVNGDAGVSKVYIAAFGSDRLVVLATNGGPASTWTRTLIGIAMTPQPNDYSRTGPRGLAINASQKRLYCMNQLANSVSVIDLSTDTEAVRFPLQWDMTPRVVRSGRRFLYSAEFSGNQMVACSSCHVAARTDSRGWDIGTPGATPVQHPAGLEDTGDPNNPGNFAADKGIMVTQSLQGLVNHPLNVAGQDLFSNKPYHWRGDRADFIAFNGAFVSLMGATDLNPSGPSKGITDTQMIRYRDFINTVMYTPNPEQAPDRVLRGSFGNANDLTSGSDALLGMKIFHIDPQNRCNGRSCVQCHRLPVGSNNRITTSGGVGGVETAALRSLFSREGRAEAPASANLPGWSNVMTTHFGLTHDGHTHGPDPSQPTFPTVVNGPASIDRFVFDSFGGFATLADYQLREQLVQFCREMDSGIAPSVGVTYTVTFANQALIATTDAFNLLEGQVRKANCGLAVYAQLSGISIGFYFDITGATDGYHQHGTTTVISRTALLALLASGDILVLQGTPAGSERRIASLNGHPGLLTGPAPTNVTLEPMRPPTHWAQVPLMTKNWDPFVAPPNGFSFTGSFEPLSIKSVRLLQRAVLQFAPTFGLTQMQHEASRRFAVAGDGIRLGARLEFRIPAPTTPGVPPPYANVAVDTTLVEMNLYPTDQFVGGRRVWETAAEADPLLINTLLLGGPAATGVAAAVNTPHLVTETATYPPWTFDPLTWNSFFVTVVNVDNTASAGSWQTLKIQCAMRHVPSYGIAPERAAIRAPRSAPPHQVLRA